MNDAQIILTIQVVFSAFFAYYMNIQINTLNYEVKKTTKGLYFLTACVVMLLLIMISEIPSRLIVAIVSIALMNKFITKNSYVFSMILSIYILFISNIVSVLSIIPYTKIANISHNQISTPLDYLFIHIGYLICIAISVKLTKHKIADMEKTLWGVDTKIGAFAVISSIPILIIVSIILPMYYLIVDLPDQNELANKWTIFSFFLLLVMGFYLAMSVNLVILYAKNKEMSQLDAMTGALNKEVGIRFIEESMNRACARNNNLVVCFVDIDNLKAVNDTLGHNEGDFLIKTVADTIQATIRKSDKMIRFGGDEFIIVFKEMNSEKAKDIVERISHKLSVISETKEYHLSVSYGLAEYVHSKYPTVHDFISEADKDMYEFKMKQKKVSSATMGFRQLEIPYDMEVLTQSNS